MKSQELNDLLQKLQDGTISTSELDTLQIWNRQLLAQQDDISSSLSDNELEVLKTRLWEAVSLKIPDQSAFIQQPVKGRILPMRMMWAAAIILTLVTATVILWQINEKKTSGTDTSQQLSKRYHNDVSPGGDRAILTLEDGATIDLTNAKAGTLDSTAGAVTTKDKDGQLSYHSHSLQTQVYASHLVTTPRGGQYRLTLSDGTIVWLNAASSLRYPVVFSGTSRQVSLTGEAYFEVAHNAAQPFIVQTDKSEVKVLGTGFNINTYEDEPDQRTTLMHGSVEIKHQGRAQRLKPGEQARVTNSGDIGITQGSDLEALTAWKDGNFVFRDSPIEPLLRQLSRWYNIDVIIEKPIAGKFTVDISRKENLSQILQLLEMTGGVQFIINGNKVSVRP